MHDCTTLKNMSIAQLQNMIRTIDSRLAGVSPDNEYVYELLLQQQDVFRQEISERTEIESLKMNTPAAINLTTDSLSEEEEKNKHNGR